MEEKFCYFYGNNDIGKDGIFTENTKNILKDTNKMIIENNVTHFICTSENQLQMWCGQIVLKLKNKYPNIRLILIISKGTKSYTYDEKYFIKFLTKNADKVIKNNDEIKYLMKKAKYIIKT